MLSGLDRGGLPYAQAQSRKQNGRLEKQRLTRKRSIFKENAFFNIELRSREGR